MKIYTELKRVLGRLHLSPIIKSVKLFEVGLHMTDINKEFEWQTDIDNSCKTFGLSADEPNILDLQRTSRLDVNFQYTEIDEKSLELLKNKDLHEPLGEKVELTKWCIDTNHPIALLYTGWVSSSIARTDGSSYWYFMLIVNGHETSIVFARKGLSINAEKHLIQPSEIKVLNNFAEKSGFTLEEIKWAVCEAIRVFEIGEHHDYEERRKHKTLERIRITPNKIMQGEFSAKLRQCINSITEIQNMEQLFRAICLKHFREYNVAVQHYDGFYLHQDEDSFFIFDVILWMYLHIEKNTTIETFISEYPFIANEEYMYKADVYEKHFCIGGAISFLKDNYFPFRIQEKKIILDEGKIGFSLQYLETIIQQLKNS